MNKNSFLRTTPLLADVDKVTVAELKQYVFEKRLKRGQKIPNETNEAAQALYFVVEGAMKAYRASESGKEQILALLRPGDFFNEVLLDDGPAMASAEALGATLLYGIKKADLRVAMGQYPQIADNLLGMLSWRVRHLTSLVEDLSFLPVLGRVAKIILENAQAAEKPRLTQRELAAIAGSVREVVSRALGHLEELGFIEMRKRQIVIKNPGGLKKLVDQTA